MSVNNDEIKNEGLNNTEKGDSSAKKASESSEAVKKSSSGEKDNKEGKAGIKSKKSVFEFIIGLLATLTFAFTIFFYIPYETLATNTISMEFPLSAAVSVFALVALCVFVVSFLIVTFLRGTPWKILVSLFTGLAFCAYVQSTFLNSGLGTLNGDKIDWSKLTGQTILSLVIWLLILVGVFMVAFARPKIWRTVVTVMCIMAVVMQGVGFIGVLASDDNKVDTEVNFVLTDEDYVTYSSEKNVIVFCLDRLDQKYIEDVEKKDPDFFQDLDGFTQYTDATSGFYRTKPGANYLLTSYNATAYKESWTNYLDHSWNYENRHILDDLDAANVKIGLHEVYKVFFGDASPYLNKVANLVDVNSNVDKGRLFSNVMKLTMFRAMPTIAKRAFWMDTDDVNEDVMIDVDDHSDDETKFDEQIEDMELETTKASFKFYHFTGSHAPYTLDADGHALPDGEESDSTTKTMGSFNIVKRALNKMKELGIYDDATIIITGDHGKIKYDSRALTEAERLGMFYKPSGSYDTPLVQSDMPVSQANVPSTILKELGIDYSNYGYALDEVTAENTPIRYSQKTVSVEGKEKELVTYQITGKAGDWNNWEVINDEEIRFSYN